MASTCCQTSMPVTFRTKVALGINRVTAKHADGASPRADDKGMGREGPCLFAVHPEADGMHGFGVWVLSIGSFIRNDNEAIVTLIVAQSDLADSKQWLHGL